uniref:tetratricopeptide repeat protein n=1 Tax=Pseudomonas aeruginosa TaxID=287 RepID=UPI003967A198
VPAVIHLLGIEQCQARLNHLCSLHGPHVAAGAGQEQEAQDFYRKALYLEPQHAEALAHLAALLAARGDHAGARRLQQRAARGVNKDG